MTGFDLADVYQRHAAASTEPALSPHAVPGAEVSVTRTAYAKPELAKLPGQPEGYLKAALPVLAALRPLDYGRCRKQVAKDGGVAVQYIDAEVKPLQPKEKNDGGGQGSSVMFEPDESWPWPIEDGAALLDNLAGIFSRYVVLPKHGAEVLALWTVHSHAYDAFYASPILALLSPEKSAARLRL